MEALDSSTVWDLIESPPLATISEAQWDLIEHLAAQAGEAGRASGNLWQWGTATADRLMTLAEMPGAGILSLVNHLLMLRRDDLMDAILSADYDGEIVHQLAIRSAGIETEREKVAEKYRPPENRQPEDAHPRTQWAEEHRQQRWKEAQEKPQETLAKIAEITDADPKMYRPTLDKIAQSLGIRHYGRKEYGEADPRKQELSEQINDRIEILRALAAPAPEPLPVVLTEGEPAPGPQDVAIVVPMAAEPEPERAGPPPLTAEVLIAEALDPQRRQPTTIAAIAGWQARPGTPWRQWFRHLRDHLGPSAAAAIAEATGASFEEVRLHGEAVWARHEGDLAQLRAAYPTLDSLMADALPAPGWEWLSAGLGVGIEALWGHAAALAMAERPGAL